MSMELSSRSSICHQHSWAQLGSGMVLPRQPHLAACFRTFIANLMPSRTLACYFKRQAHFNNIDGGECNLEWAPELSQTDYGKATRGRCSCRVSARSEDVEEVSEQQTAADVCTEILACNLFRRYGCAHVVVD